MTKEISMEKKPKTFSEHQLNAIIVR